MKKIITSMIVVGAMLCLTSCITSQSSLNDLRTLSAQINNEGSTYSISKWEKVGKKFYKTDKRIAYFASKKVYTDAELKEIGTLNRQCADGFVDSAKGTINSALNFLDGLLGK